MKRLLIPLVIISLLSSITLGLAAMNHLENGQGHSQCPFDAMNLINCDLVKNSFDFIALHLNLFSRMFSATLFASVSLSLFFVLVFGLLAVFRGGLPVLKPHFLVTESRLQFSFVPSAARRTTRWLALRENSPAFAARRWN